MPTWTFVKAQLETPWSSAKNRARAPYGTMPLTVPFAEVVLPLNSDNY